MDIDNRVLTLSNLIIQMSADFKGFKIELKSTSILMKSINFILRMLTFGKFQTFMTNYVTTIGHTVFVPDTWDRIGPASKYIILMHEKVHMEQSRRYGKLLYSILYLFVYLPCGLAYFRTKFEKEAYIATIKAAAEMYGKSYVKTAVFRDKIVGYFTGPDYFYMWVRKDQIEQWVYDVTSSI